MRSLPVHDDRTVGLKLLGEFVSEPLQMRLPSTTDLVKDHWFSQKALSCLIVERSSFQFLSAAAGLLYTQTIWRYVGLRFGGEEMAVPVLEVSRISGGKFNRSRTMSYDHISS